MSNSAINTQVAQQKIGNVQNQADSSAVYSAGVWSFKNSSAVTSFSINDSGVAVIGPASGGTGHTIRTGGTTFGSNKFHMHITDTSSLAAGNGGGISFGAIGAGTTISPDLGGIRISKENATSGDYSYSMKFYTSTSAGSFTERMAIDSSGNLLVGTTSNVGNNRVKIAGGTQPGLQVDCSTSTTAGGIEIDVGSNNATQLALQVYSTSNSAVNALIYSNGTFGSRTSTYGGISDIKLKNNVVDATSKLEDLCKVRVVNYNLIGEQEKHLGVIAQELEQVFPGMVFESPDRDAEGKETGEVTKSVKYSIFIPMLIKALQELSAKVDAQAEEIKALKAS